MQTHAEGATTPVTQQTQIEPSSSAQAPAAVGEPCSLFVDMAPDQPEIAPGDWIATAAGSRYVVLSSRLRMSRTPRQKTTYVVRCARLPKHGLVPDDVRVVWLTWHPRDPRRRALGDSDAQGRCTHPTPFVAYTEPTCKREAGHTPPHRFTSLDGRTDMEQFPTAKELGR